MASYATGNRRSVDPKLHVDAEARPGWCCGADVTLSAGDTVFCTEGMAEVVKVLGKTGDGSRLLELRLPVTSAKPFFAAASNVLVAPPAA
jgi:hypothetical protein